MFNQSIFLAFSSRAAAFAEKSEWRAIYNSDRVQRATLLLTSIDCRVSDFSLTHLIFFFLFRPWQSGWRVAGCSHYHGGEGKQLGCLVGIVGGRRVRRLRSCLAAFLQNVQAVTMRPW